jgi:hypothetical protein
MDALNKLKCPHCEEVGVSVTDDSNEMEGPLYALICDFCGRYISDKSWQDSSGPYEEAAELFFLQNPPVLTPKQSEGRE